MRTIEFRARNSKGELIYGLPYTDGVSDTIYFEDYSNRLCWRRGDGAHCNQPYKNGTLEQFTGLLDKNGKKIFEGDIIEHYALYGSVIFEDGMFSISSNAKTQFCNCRQPMAFHDINEMEVIGNIHDNPELIK